LGTSAGVMMRGVAKCDKHHDQQCSVKQKGPYYALCFEENLRHVCVCNICVTMKMMSQGLSQFVYVSESSILICANTCNWYSFHLSRQTITHLHIIHGGAALLNWCVLFSLDDCNV